MASLDDIATAFNSQNQNQSALVNALIAALATVFPRVSSIAGGTFTCAAAATTTVTQTLTQANSIVLIVPTNAAAGTLMAGATSLYLSARTANASFAFSTANGAAAAGTETFAYLCIGL